MKTMRGFGYTIHKAGEPVYNTQNGHAWSEAGTLPAEWEAIKEDPTIDQAKLYTNAQSHRRADKRRVLDTKEQAS